MNAGRSRLAVAAGVAWLVVAAAASPGIFIDTEEHWELYYAVCLIALVVGTTLAVAVATLVTRPPNRPTRWRFGVGTSCLGIAASFIAWAIPLWMTVLGIGFALIATGADGHMRAQVSRLSVAQFAGLAVFALGAILEVGRTDSYGEHPAAGALGVVVTGVLMAAGMWRLARLPAQLPAAEMRPAPRPA